MSRVTVCIPTYNRPHLLAESIESVLDQTFTDFELLIADNASTDNTEEVVAAFKDSRIRYYRHATNIGLMQNYRFVLTTPTTEFVAYLSDDDLYVPQHLDTAIRVLDTFPRAAYFASSATYFGSTAHGELRPHAIWDTRSPLIYFSPQHAVDFLGIDSPGPMTVVRRRVLHDQICWPRPDYLPIDLMLLTQLMIQGGFVFCNRPMMRFRLHDSNASHTPNERLKRLRFNCMVWFGVRWLAQFLFGKGICSLSEIEAHGMQARSEQHVVPLVIALGSFDSPPPLRAIAKRVFQARTDMDAVSARFRLARRVGFSAIPLSEKISQVRSGWRP